MNDPYSRVYWSVMDDEKFDGIREDVRLFGSWALLLGVADMAWPAPAFTPPTVPRRALARLSDCGLIDQLPGHRFRVHGLGAEREKRSDSARNAAALRWHKNRNAEPMLDEDETRTRRGIAETDDPAWLTAWFQTGHAYLPSPKQRDVIDAYLRAFDVTGDARLADVFLRNPSDPIAGLKADLEAFRAERRAAADDDETDHAERARSASREKANRTLLVAYHNNGAHTDAPVPECPECGRNAA